jgi:adenylate kinase
MEKFTLGCTLLISALTMAVLSASPSPSMPLVVILLGPPGSGKGTQAVMLSQKLKVPHISTGDLFRENISANTDLGKKAKSFTEIGKLVPDEVVLDMLFERIKRNDCLSGFVLDGFPRTIPQARALDLKLANQAKLIVLNLNVQDDLIVKRIEGRLSCKNCSQIYNKYYSPPLKPGLCDKCGSSLDQRLDDNKEVVKERLFIYHQQTKPLVDYYSIKGILSDINGENSPEVVSQHLFKCFENL